MGCLLSKPIEDNPLPLSNTVPYDIMLDILCRLPHKSLVRFRCVSRSWCNLRADTYFIRLNAHCVFKHEFFLRDKNQNLYALVHEESAHQLVQIDHPMYTHCVQILGTCDGLLCTQGRSKFSWSDTIYIWNTFTKQCRKLPCPEEINYLYPDATYDFFYNPNTNDYEVVCMVYMGQHLISCHSKVFVYSLRKDSWRKIGEIPYQISKAPGEVVNGSLHWMAVSIHMCRKVVIAYETLEEKFIEVQLPNSIIIYFQQMVREFQGKLCLFHADSCRGKNFDIWVMNEYRVTESWTKLFTIAKPTSLGYVCEFLLCFTKNGLVVMRGDDNDLILDDAVSGRRQVIQGTREVAQVTNNYMERVVQHVTYTR